MSSLTNVVAVPVGANILGLLTFFGFLGGTFLPLSLSDTLPRGIPNQVLLIPGLLSLIAVASFDLWWRLSQAQPERWKRLLYPIHGGCLFFVPIWLLFPGWILAATLVGIVATIAGKAN